MSYFKHPELRDGEKLLGNFTEESYRKVRWKTKRKGIKPYLVDGRNFNFYKEHGVFPVFVSIEEAGETTMRFSGPPTGATKGDTHHQER